MAKKIMDWTFTDAGLLTCEHKDVEPSKKQDFDLTCIFPDFADLDNIQKNVVVYGTKQKLADSVAVSKDMAYTVNERIATLSNMWSRLRDGVWSQKGGERDTPQKRLNSMSPEAKAALSPEQKKILIDLGFKL
jgi:hypothetical protein